VSYAYGRIRLQDTKYSSTNTAWSYIHDPNIAELNNIYRRYCRYRQFASVMPIFDSEYTDSRNDIIGYYDLGQLEAFSIVRRFDNENAQCIQFAWTYHRPKLRLGIESLKTECAIYRDRGFRYLYLDQAHEYKQQFEGFELLGPLE
jgi:hypothetical protein